MFYNCEPIKGLQKLNFQAKTSLNRSCGLQLAENGKISCRRANNLGSNSAYTKNQ